MKYISGAGLGFALSALLSGCATGQQTKTPFELAVDSGDDAAVTKAIAGIRDLNAPGAHSPLRYAAYGGKSELVKLLLDRGARIDAGVNGWTALHTAAAAGRLEIVKLLVECGADVNAVDLYTNTPLQTAALSGSLESVKYLAAKGARIDAELRYRDGYYNGLTAVGVAAKNNHPAIVRFLIEAGADVGSSISALGEGAKANVKHRWPDQTGMVNSGRAVEMLRRYSSPAGSPAAPTAGGLSKSEMEQIVKSAMATSQPAPAAAPSEIKSDVDAPSYKVSVNPDAFAVVIGAEKYNTLPEARFAERDAKAMSAHLLAMGYPQRNIILLTGVQATKTGLVKNIEAWLPNNVTERSTVFFYFSGHGAPDANTSQAYLVPIDGDPQYLEETAYPIKRLYERLAALKAKRVIVALDSCFSGAGGRSVLARGTRPLVSKLSLAPGAGKIVALSASSAEEISGAAEEQGHGLFTYQLLKALGETAGRGTVSEIYAALKPRVQDEARRENRAQTPQVTGSTLESGLR